MTKILIMSFISEPFDIFRQVLHDGMQTRIPEYLMGWPEEKNLTISNGLDLHNKNSSIADARMI